MHLDLDVRHVRACMAMWRETVAMRPDIPAASANADRAKLLKQAATTVTGWLDLLRMCSASDSDLQAIRSEIAAFQEWADEGAEGLRLLAETERGRLSPCSSDDVDSTS